MREKIKRYFEENKNIIIKELSELIKIPSTGGEKGDNDAIQRVFSISCEKAEKYGFKTEIKKKYALAKIFEGKKRIGIFSHLDVVPADENSWTVTKPFSPLLKNGALFGRGSVDDKCAAVIAWHAADAVKKLNIPFNSEIVLFMGGDEECGMEDIEDFVKEERIPDNSLVPDNDFPVCLGEKGIAVFELESRKKLDSIKSIYGGTAHNISLGEITAEVGAEKLEEKGVSAHAASPEGSVNAGFKLADRLLEENLISENDREIILLMRNMLKSPYGEYFGIDCNDSRFGKLTFVNGIVKTEEGRLFLTFDLRYGTESDFEQITEKIRASAEGFDVKMNKPPFVLPEGGLGGKFEKIYSEVTGENKKAYYSGGGTYARMLKNAYSVGVSTKEAATLPPGHGNEHQPDECISVEGMLEAAEIITLMLIEADRSL